MILNSSNRQKVYNIDIWPEILSIKIVKIIIFLVKIKLKLDDGTLPTNCLGAMAHRSDWKIRHCSAIAIPPKKKKKIGHIQFNKISDQI